MSKWTSKNIELIKAVLENLELNYKGGRSGHGHAYHSRPKRVYGDKKLIDDENNIKKDIEGNVKVSRAFAEDDDE